MSHSLSPRNPQTIHKLCVFCSFSSFIFDVEITDRAKTHIEFMMWNNKIQQYNKYKYKKKYNKWSVQILFR